MFTIGNSILKLLGRDSDAPRWLAALAFVIVLLLACTACWGAFQVFDWFNDRDAVRDAANEANADFQQEKDEATGAADAASQINRAALEASVKRTEELVDEALEKNCVISDYLASNGADCVRRGAPVRNPAP